MIKNFTNILKWGLLLWTFGYILGFVFFFILPASVLGWAILPFGVLITVYVCTKKIEIANIKNATEVGIIWTVWAILLDYLFIVKLLSPIDGYYKLDVYVYYLLTLLIPIFSVVWKNKKIN